jgi:hypothetical protein
VTFALDAVRGLKASWRLLRMDDDGFEDFDLSADGFWNSFAAVFLVAPLYLYSSSASAKLAMPQQPEPAWLSTLALLALLWVLWPWIMITITHMLGSERKYVRYIAAYNWSSVYVIAAIVPTLILQQAGIIGPNLSALLSLIIILWSLYFRWYVAHKALEVRATTASMLVAVDLALSIFASSFV